jgi:hypothetical protein
MAIPLRARILTRWCDCGFHMGIGFAVGDSKAARDLRGRVRPRLMAYPTPEISVKPVPCREAINQPSRKPQTKQRSENETKKMAVPRSGHRHEFKNNQVIGVDTLGDSAPGPIGVTAGCATHRLGTAVDVDGVVIIAAVIWPAAVGLAWDNFAIAAVFRVTPSGCNARLTALKSGEFSLLGQDTVLLIHRLANFAANDAPNDGACHRGHYVAFALAELITNNATSDGADGEARVLLGDVAISAAASKAD